MGNGSEAFTVDNYIELQDADFDSYVVNPWTWIDPVGGTPKYVYILPPIAIAVLISKLIILSVYVREKLISSANIIMMGIAISDTLTVLFPTPLVIYIFWWKYCNFIPYDLCVPWEYLMKNMCAVTHTASVWLTMYLGINRYMGICHPFTMLRKCTIKSTVQTIVLIYVLSFLFHLCRFVDTVYVPELAGNNLTNTCSARYADWLPHEHQRTYEFVYHWCHIIFISIIPSSTLVILDTIMLRHIRNSDIKRSVFLKGSQSKDRQKHTSESLRRTKTIVVILAIVCVSELSLGVLLILWTLTMMDLIHIPEDILGPASNFTNFSIYISYPIIFLLYCQLSSQFRNGIKRMFLCKRTRRESNAEIKLQTLFSNNSTI